MALIEFKKVSKNFGAIKALTDISFKIDKGEFVFLAGPSGSGKTTILRLLLGEIQPSAGEIFFDEQRVNDVSAKQLPKLRQKIGVVFQDFRLLPERTIRENIEVALAVKRVSEKEWEERVNQVLKVVGLADRSELFPAQLSGGELQRVSLARALVVNPKVIFADEPTGNLDWETAEGVMQLLLHINKEGKTVIVASHHESIIKELKKRVIRLNKGKLV
jgi:cell division transport system ATP-binding protein